MPLLLLLLFTSGSTAQSITVSFPLDGRYRVGKYMPVRVLASGAPQGGARTAVTLAADGATPTELPLGDAEADVVVPWLAVRELANPRWSLAGGAAGAGSPIDAPLRPLGVDERLVAVAGEPQSSRALAMMFPGTVVVPVRLDVSRPGPLLSPPAAYEALDGVVLDAGAAGRVGESQLAVLLAGGTTVAVKSDAKPGGAWAWRKEGSYWVVRHDPVGPRSVVEMEAYQPTYGWVRGWPPDLRRQAVLLAAVFVILVLGLALWRSRWAVFAVVGLSVAATGAVAAWGAGRSPVLSAGGAVEVWDGDVTQRDEWAYRTTLRPADVSFPCGANGGLTRPVLASRAQAQRTGVRLVCAPDGRPDFLAARLETDNALAALTRSLHPARPQGGPATPVASPMSLLADKLYPGRVVGQAPPGRDAGGEGWAAVVLDNAPPPGSR